jgi:hypothetical protein
MYVGIERIAVDDCDYQHACRERRDTKHRHSERQEVKFVRRALANNLKFPIVSKFAGALQGVSLVAM